VSLKQLQQETKNTPMPWVGGMAEPLFNFSLPQLGCRTKFGNSTSKYVAVNWGGGENGSRVSAPSCVGAVDP